MTRKHLATYLTKKILPWFITLSYTSLMAETTYVFTTFNTNGNVVAVNATTGAIVNTISGTTHSEQVAVASNGNVGCLAGTNVFVFNPTQSSSLKNVTNSDGSLFSGSNVTITGDGKTAFSLGSDGLVYRIDTGTAIATNAIAVANEAIAVNNSGSVLCIEIATSLNGSLNIFNPLTNTSKFAVNEDGTLFQNEFSFCMTADGKTIYAIGMDLSGSTQNIYAVNSDTATVFETIQVIPLSQPSPVLVRSVVNDTGSIICATDHPGNIWIIPTDQSSAPVKVNGPFQPKVGYGDLGTLGMTPDGKTAYAFNNGILYAIDTSTASSSIIHNFGSNRIYSLSTITTNAVGSSFKESDSWQTDIYNVISWNEFFTPASFVIFRNGNKIATVQPNKNSFEDHYLKPNTNYNYEVFSVWVDGSISSVGTVQLKTKND